MNPYKINPEDIVDSNEITDTKSLLKIKLAAVFIKETKNMETADLLRRTKIDKADLSRIRAMNLERFTIDKLVSILESVGLKTTVNITKIAS